MVLDCLYSCCKAVKQGLSLLETPFAHAEEIMFSFCCCLVSLLPNMGHYNVEHTALPMSQNLWHGAYYDWHGFLYLWTTDTL